MTELDVIVDDERWEELGDVEALSQAAAQAALDAAAYQKPCIVSILFTTDEALRTMNRTWRNIDKPTNVLSFPASKMAQIEGTPCMLGDIALSFDTLQREANTDHKTLKDHSLHLIIHGVLHLIGYDHETDAEAKEMEGLEVKALASLGVKNPYEGIF